jgi:hypothetical protein
MGLDTPAMNEISFEAINIGHFWKIFLITSSRRIYSKGLTLRQANMAEF